MQRGTESAATVDSSGAAGADLRWCGGAQQRAVLRLNGRDISALMMCTNSRI